MLQSKHSKFPIFLAVLLAAIWLAPTAALAEVKIGVINMEQAVNDCKQGKRSQAELRRKAAKLEDELKQLTEDVQKLRKDLENTAMLLKPEAKLANEREFERKARRLNDRRRDAQQEIREAQRDAFAPILRRMQEVIKVIGAKGGYALITESRSALFYPQSADITSAVIAAYDKKFP
ncbi:MAG: OmpH family outer membrane protein [Proteobacteria bacterium]|nr:OmpH family outer membrane protein [Pseudomonadota bacterium]MBU1453001.1 OmpH family outer membrane protein [Pseudomonadota bacterium]MBU2469502.1 OmpH family outer membrane protein [Pseudomonadota bacterium]MBU2518831.1 OmpH family outer membrane protein [Pseudomonadota bacterium]